MLRRLELSEADLVSLFINYALKFHFYRFNNMKYLSTIKYSLNPALGVLTKKNEVGDIALCLFILYQNEVWIVIVLKIFFQFIITRKYYIKSFCKIIKKFSLLLKKVR